LYALKTTRDANLFQENEKRGDLSHRTAKAALNMITVDLARELAPDKISCITMSPGWVQIKMSNWTGPLEAAKAVTWIIKVIDSLKPSDTALFCHSDGHLCEE
jgi:NAD(P)-dependent dehydrogenase (short-subunit alcohol dehydrogenase family)